MEMGNAPLSHPLATDSNSSPSMKTYHDLVLPDISAEIETVKRAKRSRFPHPDYPQTSRQ